MFAFSRAYCGGCIISAIAYFAYILIVPEIEATQSSHKAASLTSVLSENKEAFKAAVKRMWHAPSDKKATVATALAFCGAAIQLGAIAVLHLLRISGNQGNVTPFPDLPSADSSRRLLGQPSDMELEIRAGMAVSVEWYVV